MAKCWPRTVSSTAATDRPGNGSPFALGVAIGFEALTAVPTAAMPPFIGAYVDRLGYGLEQAGRIASAETIGMAVGQAVVLLVFTRAGWDLRRSMTVAMLAFAAAQFVSAWAPSESAFVAARFVSGMTGGGMAFATAGVYIASLPRPDRPYVFFYGILFVVGPIGLFGLPLLFDSLGLAGTYSLIGAATVVSLVFVRAYPRHRLEAAGASGAGDRASSARLSPALLVVVAVLLASLFANYLSNGGVWVYLERIGEAMAIGAESRGLLLAVGMACGVLGSLAALLCADRLNRWLWIAVGQLLLLGSYAVLLAGATPGAFLAAAILLNVAVTFYTPFYLSQLSAIDPSGRSATIGMMTFGFGYGLGPALLALFLDEGRFAAMLLAASAALVVSLALLGLAAVLQQRAGGSMMASGSGTKS